MSMATWLESEADANMRIFLGMARAQDLVPKVKKAGKPVPGLSGKVQPEGSHIQATDEEN